MSQCFNMVYLAGGFTHALNDVLRAAERERLGVSVSKLAKGRRAGDGEAHHSRASEVVKCQVADAGTIGELAPRRPEPVLSFVMR
jgi:hypothetical protein